jgi:GNAT superfamily N-acetyltransferase
MGCILEGILMEFYTIDYWDELKWQQVSPIYSQAFSEKGAKPEKIIRNMFRKGLCYLHVGTENDQVKVMSLTGRLNGVQSLLIDYLAVREEDRGKGNGLKMMEYISSWSLTDDQFTSHLIEVESEETPENLARIAFWKKCGFQLTDYIHHYIWVPEPYLAMYHKLDPSSTLPVDGKQLFKYISQFHKTSYGGA